MSSCILRWVTSTNELNFFKFDKLFIRGPPESIMLSDLPEECNDNLSSIFIFIWEIDFITEYNQPFFLLFWTKNYSMRSLFVFTIVIKSFDDEIWHGG